MGTYTTSSDAAKAANQVGLVDHTAPPSLASNGGGHRSPNQPPAFDKTSVVGNIQAAHEDQVAIPLLYFDNPIQAFWWFMSWMIPGMGMFCEAYFIFSIGNIKPLLQTQYPRCWKQYITCQKHLVESVDYLQIVGIIFGMGLVGYVGDRIGRKWGSVMTVSIMLVGSIMLACVNGTYDTGFIIMYMVSQFVFGFGVGGEYPMAAGSAAERAEAGGREKAKHRGAEVVLTFSMQGVGNFTNTAVLIILMVIFGANKAKNAKLNNGSVFSGHAISATWRTAFGLGAIPLIFLIYYRTVWLRESAVWAAQTREKGKTKNDLYNLFVVFWPRLLCTAGAWFLWDFSFYGNKVFQSAFIAILSPGASPIINLEWTLLNSFCALVGYYISAMFIDNPYAGRLRIQLFGFLMVATLFYVAGAAYGPLTTKGGIKTFQFVYFFSSFWGQFGPNCTTFLLAGELYPTEMRTTAHGVSAALGKMGALWASVWFNYLAARDKFWSTATFNVAGAIVTYLFTPDCLRLSLTEQDRAWAYRKAGKPYHGEAVNPRNLSVWERMTGQGRNWDRALDFKDRQAEGFLHPSEAKMVGANQPVVV